MLEAKQESVSDSGHPKRRTLRVSDMRFDLILRGGTIVESEAVQGKDVAITNGKVVAQLARGEPAEAAAVVDLYEKHLMPGLVDAHVHFREPGMTWKEDFESGTRAAIAGRVTTALVMPTDDPWTVTADQFRTKTALAQRRLFSDVGLQVAVRRGHRDLANLAALGAVSFEIFTADVPEAFRHAALADLKCSIEAVRAVRGMAAISPGNQSLLESELSALSPGRSSAEDFVRSRASLAEADAIARIVLTAAALDEKVHIRQSNSLLGFTAYARLRDLADVSIETSPQCLIFTASDYKNFGPQAKASPPWREESDRNGVRAALSSGLIDIVVSDHAPHLAREKLAQVEDFAAIPGGFPGVQTLLGTLLSLVGEKLLGLQDVVRVAARRPAERFGLGSRKGRLQPGFDADILVLDSRRTSTIRRSAQLSKVDFTPFDGRHFPFALERVFLRGRQVFGPAGVGEEATGMPL
jgi:dihydroorotase